MGPLGEIFNPGMRHEIEERRSKALRREEDGNARDGDLRIDLDSGFVNIVALPAPVEVPGAARTGATADQPVDDKAIDGEASEASAPEGPRRS